jgi:AbiV family abortive infection protein
VTQDRDRPIRQLPDLTGPQVVELQDALLSNADRLLTAALTVLQGDNIALSRSLVILALEESGKAIALHQRRVQIAYAPEGERFVNDSLNELWANHKKKLELVHQFLVDEQYWFAVEPPDPDATAAYLGAVKRWAERHDKLKQRGFYVDVSKSGQTMTPAEIKDEPSLRDVIEHVHQIGWQLRLGEHIEAKSQVEWAAAISPVSEAEIEQGRQLYADAGIDRETIDDLLAAQLEGRPGRVLNNDAYRLHLPGPDSAPFAHLGKPGYEAESRELLRLARESDDAPDTA